MMFQLVAFVNYSQKIYLKTNTIDNIESITTKSAIRTLISTKLDENKIVVSKSALNLAKIYNLASNTRSYTVQWQ